MPSKYEVKEKIQTVNGNNPLEAGEIYKITQNPKQTPRSDEHCIEVLHKSKFHLENEDYTTGKTVKKEEFINKTEKMGRV